MNTFLLALMFWGPLGLSGALVTKTFQRARRDAGWCWAAWRHLLLAFVVVSGATAGWLFYIRANAPSDAASRATMLAHGISQVLNYGVPVVGLGALLCGAYYGYRFAIKQR